MLLLTKPPADRHSLFEDLQGIVVGTTLIALAIQFLRATDLFTGQIAGLSLVTIYATGWSFGLTFFLMNLPFYLFGYRLLGRRFLIKTGAAVALMSLLADMLPLLLTISDLPLPLGAALFGILSGVGLLSLFRHGATLGGVGIVALILQDRKDIPAGVTQMGFDLFVFGAALFLFPIEIVLWSVVGTVILNIIVATNHRRDRYIAQ